MDPNDRQPLILDQAEEAVTPPWLVQSAPLTQQNGNPVVLAALASLAVALLLVFALQIVVHERDHLAASYPRLTGPLERLCEPLNCSVKALRRIEALVIESSSFTRLGEDVFRLSVALKNTAGLTLAMPSIELTLTDAQDQALVRRVLEPQDLLANTEAMESGAEWSSAIEVVLASPVAIAVNSYRLVAFYP